MSSVGGRTRRFLTQSGERRALGEEHAAQLVGAAVLVVVDICEVAVVGVGPGGDAALVVVAEAGRPTRRCPGPPVVIAFV